MFSGFGVRTVAVPELRYNPMSYHNGSVWPHDNALIAAGLARYGSKAAVARIFEGLFRASLYFESHRLPELFCGFPAAAGEGPTLYPVACAPQAWAAASVLLLLQAALGLSIHAGDRTVSFSRPFLPDLLESIVIRDLRAGEASLDLAVERHESDVAITVLSRRGDARVVVVK
jgi:glycogen debranching enzyme